MRKWITSLLCFCLSITASATAQTYHPILIQIDKREPGQSLTVAEIPESQIHLDERREGLIIWEKDGKENWEYLPPGSFWKMPEMSQNKIMAQTWANDSRGQNGNINHATEQITATAQLEQLTTLGMFKGGKKLLIPYRGISISPNLTISKYKFQSDASVQPAGFRSVRMSENTVFDLTQDAQDLQILERLANLVPRTDSLYLQIAAECLLYHRNKEGKLQPYFADALDILQTVPEKALTSYLLKTKKEILDYMNSSKEVVPARPSSDSTGIALIDIVRRLIIANRWHKALEKLKEGKDSKDIRTHALCKLYKGVIVAESGTIMEDRATLLFEESLQELKGGSEADLFLVHSNYANALLKQAQDRLYSHSFQISAGVKCPLIRLLLDWIRANFHYQKAYELAGKLKNKEKIVIQINTARLYLLLADIIRTLDVSQNAGHFIVFTRASEENIYRQTDEIWLSPEAPKSSSFFYAVAAEMRSHLEFRHGNFPACWEASQKALNAYRETGSLAGMESIYRLLGLYYLKLVPSQPGQGFSENQSKSLHYFFLSQIISEVLQRRMQGDAIGLTQAGFFGRRTYVYENIVELLLAAGKDKDALQYAEKSKAQALGDVLTMQGTQVSQETKEIEKILARWPGDIVSLEYFFGTERAYIFVVNISGQVKGYLLVDSQKRAIASRVLIGQIEQFLHGIDHYAQHLLQKLRMGQGVDHSWQNRLHDFYCTLIPPSVREELKKAKTVIIVPHHILHYFPFAALVTEIDQRRLGSFEMAKPKFLLDEPFHICIAPSLAIWDLLHHKALCPVENVMALGISDFPGVPLKGVTKDIANLKAAFGEKVKTVYFNGVATEAKARELLGQRGFLLFATHGVNNPDKPLESYLRLYPDANYDGHSIAHDGHLSALEIFIMRSNVDIVVLSACYSGLADRSPLPGDDLFGLSRAFLQSGTRTVLSGLWDVYDGTEPELMRIFFENCAKKISPPQALADSQRSFLKKLRASREFEPWLHPYFWAVYNIVGDDRVY